MGRTIRLLLADNYPDFVDAWAEWLRNRGYVVLTAGSLEEARFQLEHAHVHVAVLDLRLVKNNDPEDRSGLDLAMASDPAIPKIMLTAS